MHVSYEGGILEDPWAEPPADIFQMTKSPEDAQAEAEYVTDRLRERRAGQRERRAARARSRCCGVEPAGRRARHRARRSGRESFRRDEVARRVRDAGRDDPAGGAPRARIDHAGPRSDAAARFALGVKFAESVYYGFWFAPEVGADAAHDRRDAKAGDGRRAPEALQRQRHGGRPPRAALALQRAARDLRGRRRSTTSATPKASSSSTRCACACARSSTKQK